MPFCRPSANLNASIQTTVSSNHRKPRPLTCRYFISNMELRSYGENKDSIIRSIIESLFFRHVVPHMAFMMGIVLNKNLEEDGLHIQINMMVY